MHSDPLSHSALAARASGEDRLCGGGAYVLEWYSRATDEESLAVRRNPRLWPECNAGTMATTGYDEGPPAASVRAFFLYALDSWMCEIGP